MIQRKNTIKKRNSPSNNSNNATLMTKNKTEMSILFNRTHSEHNTLLAISSPKISKKSTPKRKKATKRNPILLKKILKRQETSRPQKERRPTVVKNNQSKDLNRDDSLKKNKEILSKNNPEKKTEVKK